MTLRLWAAAATDVGNIRDNNQDDLLIVEDALFVVADGMGGHVAGEVASREAVDALRRAYEAPGSTDDVRQAVRLANGAVWQRGTDNPSYRGMGTTVTAVAVVDDDKLAIANVGDSRTYLLRDGELVQLTQDHSFVQEAVRSGQLTQSQAESHPRRSQLTRALGVADDVDVDVDVIEPLTGDRLLLCSDGLWDEVGDELITMVLTNHAEPAETAAKLVLWAKEAGGRDNITVIVLDVVDGGEDDRAISASAALDASGEAATATGRADPPSAAGDGGPAEGGAPGLSGSSEFGAPTLSGGYERGGDGPARRRAWDPNGTSGASTRDLGAAGVPRAPDPGFDSSLMQPVAVAAAPRSRLLTWRVVAFAVVLVGVLVAAAVIVARGGPAWAVALDGNDVVVRKGSEIVDRPPLQVNQLPRPIQDELARGKRVESRADAKRYIDGIAVIARREGTLKPDAGVVVTTTTSAAAAPGPAPSAVPPAAGP